MATYNRIDRLEFRRMVESGATNKQLAEHFKVSFSAVEKVKRELGLTKKRLDHSEAIPWKLKAEHNLFTPATYMRHLSRVIAGDTKIPAYYVATAVRWAEKIVNAGRDIAYDRERGLPEPDSFDAEVCPDGGFYTVPWDGDPKESHLGKLLVKVEERRSRS